MYSRDVYSYLAQSEIAINGLDPYKVGPATGLGLDHVFTLSVPTMWRETPAPYGPLFLWIGQGISALTGENIVFAVLFHRLVVLLGVGLIVWAVPRLARRCGVAEVSALWLGAANPLLIMHLVAGIHNEALMLGLMLAGTEFALRGVYADSPLLPKPLAWPQSRDEWVAVATDDDADNRRRADHAVVTGEAARDCSPSASSRWRWPVGGAAPSRPSSSRADR